MRDRLHRRLFLTMGIAIFLTLGALGGSLVLLAPQLAPFGGFDRLESFVALEFRDAWANQERRDTLAQRAVQNFHVALSLKDASDGALADYGGGCLNPAHKIPIHARPPQGNGQQGGLASGQQGGELLGSVWICQSSHFTKTRWPYFVAFGLSGVVLWMIAGVAARRLARPLWELVIVTRELGKGRLSSRARLGRHHAGEVGYLAHSINEMATRIEKQVADQKELLAGVSHEIRTPLARLRVLTELLRDSGTEDKRLQQVEREIAEIDDLTGRLLASARLDFDARDAQPLDVEALAREALTRAGVAQDVLELRGERRLVMGDPTLLGRALVNLLHNAQTHGGGVKRLLLEFDAEQARATIEDKGPGFSDADLRRAFDSFYRGQGEGRTRGSLGMGLALVKRIAQAHGGDAYARNAAEGGAAVGFYVLAKGT